MLPSGVTPLRLVIGLVVGIGLVVVGGFALGVFGTPTVHGVDNSFGPVNESTTIIESDLHVENPNPFGLGVDRVTVDYEARMNEIPMATGRQEGVALPAGNSTIEFDTAMDNERIPEWWVSHLRNSERTTLAIETDVHAGLLDRTVSAPTIDREITTDLVGAFNSEEDKEINAGWPLIEDPVLIVRETRGEWGSVTESETEILMEFDVHNPREYPIVLPGIGYDIAMNDVEMGGGETDQGVVIAPGDTETLTTTFRLDNTNLDDWWVTHLENEQVTTLTADFYVRIDLSELGGGTVRIPVDTMEQTIETDIFGEREGNPKSGDERENTDIPETKTTMMSEGPSDTAS